MTAVDQSLTLATNKAMVKLVVLRAQEPENRKQRHFNHEEIKLSSCLTWTILSRILSRNQETESFEDVYSCK
jgi:hypothetical protein